MGRVESLAAGHGQAPWLFVNRNGLPFDAADIRVVFARVVKAAKLPEHLTPHCLRHTFAVELIRRGTPLPYVQAQLGHAPIPMTVDTYGRWLPSGNRTLIDQLDGDQPQPTEAERALAAGGDSPARGYKSVTNPESDDSPASETPDSTAPIPPSPAFLRS